MIKFIISKIKTATFQVIIIKTNRIVFALFNLHTFLYAKQLTQFQKVLKIIRCTVRQLNKASTGKIL